MTLTSTGYDATVGESVWGGRWKGAVGRHEDRYWRPIIGRVVSVWHVEWDSPGVHVPLNRQIEGRQRFGRPVSDPVG